MALVCQITASCEIARPPRDFLQISVKYCALIANERLSMYDSTH